MPVFSLCLHTDGPAWLSGAPPEKPESTVGWQRQLFLDDWFVDSTHNISRVLTELRRWPGHPVIVGEEPWEKWTVYLNGRGVLLDRVDDLRLPTDCRVVDNGPH